MHGASVRNRIYNCSEPASQQDVFAHPDAELYVLVGADMNVER